MGSCVSVGRKGRRAPKKMGEASPPASGHKKSHVPEAVFGDRSPENHDLVTMETVIDVIDEVSEEESKLAEKLRSCCTPLGVERQMKLEESASILLDMGKLYLEKANTCDGITQKLILVKCATLICGAKVRFEKYVFDKTRENDCRTAFKEMSTALLHFCNAEIQDADLLEISEQIGSQLKQVREEEKSFFQPNLAPISDEVPDSDIKAMEQDRIQQIKTLLEKNTVSYKAMMKFVSEQCIKILGTPPCKFCLAGLGSMAREEVTLYSDFEHVILLENGIDDSPDGEIREYFRWYSVLFHVVIIGLGETYIPTVGVKSLNDLYSEDKKRSWYFDLYTPGGVSFDGRFPHACKTPLGKQESSAFRKHVVELIQPVRKMLEFLTKDEDLKNGYHLSEVLTMTCFVDGDQDLCAEFQNGSRRHKIGGTLDQTVAEQANFVVTEINSLFNLSSVDLKRQGAERIKDLLYRPVTLLVGCLSRLFFCPCRCSLDLFPWLRNSKINFTIIAEYLHNLEYAVAVACEIRLKVYALAGQQKQKITGRDISKFIGRRCLTKSLHVVYTTANIFTSSCQKKLGIEDFVREFIYTAFSETSKTSSFFEARIAEIFGYYEGILNSYSNMTEQGELDKSPLANYVATGLTCPDRREECFRKAEELFINGDESTGSPFDALFISQVYYFQGLYQDALDVLEEWTRNLHSHSQNMEEKQRDLLDYMEGDDSLKFITPRKGTKEDFYEHYHAFSKILSGIIRGHLYVQNGNPPEAKLAFRDTIELCKTNTNQLPLQNIILPSLLITFCTQFREKWLDDATSTLELLDMIQGTDERNTIIEKGMDWIETLDSMGSFPEDGTVNLGKLVLSVQYNKKKYARDPKCGNYLGLLLGQLLMEHEIPDFNEIASCFADVPEEIFHCSHMYNGIRTGLALYYQNIMEGPGHKIGKDLMDFLTVFRQHFNNPVFIGSFQGIIYSVVTHTWMTTSDHKKEVMAHESKYAYAGASLYDEALSHYAGLDLIRSASTLWKLVYGKRISPTLKNKSCMVLAHMVKLAPFATLIRYLKDQRPAYVKHLSFPPITDSCVAYNKAVSQLVKLNQKSSAAGFWNIIHKTKNGSTLRKRSIEMMMFAIVLASWESQGFPFWVGEKYVYNKDLKKNPPLHALMGDLYGSLPGVQKDTGGDGGTSVLSILLGLLSK